MENLGPDNFGSKILILFLVVIGLIGIFSIYGLFAFISKLNKAMNGKKTPWVWIPIANTYVLGKLVLNKAFGWLLLIFTIFNQAIIYGIILLLLSLVNVFFKGDWYSNTIIQLSSFATEIIKIPPTIINIIVYTDYILLAVTFILVVIKYNKLVKKQLLK